MISYTYKAKICHTTPVLCKSGNYPSTFTEIIILSLDIQLEIRNNSALSNISTY